MMQRARQVSQAGQAAVWRRLRWPGGLWVLAAGLVGLYVLTAKGLGETGFPLDDAWIHQTYARSLAVAGRWEYVPGQVSAGSTAPLWTLMLALGYWLGIPYRAWAWGWGVALLGMTGWLSSRLTARLFPSVSWAGPAVGVLCVVEWHLVWAAASGMETILFVALSLATLQRLGSGRWPSGACLPLWRIAGPWLQLGLWSGLLVLTRPEGILLAGLAAAAGWVMMVRGRCGAGRWAWAVAAWAVTLALLLAPYLLFNLHHTGRPWPNTFYAKQTEYASLLAESLPVRLGRMALPAVTGFQLLLLPGLAWALWRAMVSRLPLCPANPLPPSLLSSGAPSGDQASLTTIVLVLYPLLHLLLYAWRLPVNYQHGRYLIPAVAPLVMAGVGGTAVLARTGHPARWRRVLIRSWLAAVAVLAVVFSVLGALAYARDVQTIQDEMVAVGRWLSEHTQPGEMVAAHDIGAIGYLSGRPILDLAGLLSPQVVQLMGDDQSLARFVLDSGAHYLVTAPGWPYRSLTDRPEVVLLYRPVSPWTAAAGLESSAVYRLPLSSPVVPDLGKGEPGSAE